MKKFTALFLIFSLVVLSGNLVAKEWKHSFSLKTQKAKDWKYGFTLSTHKTTEQHIMEKFAPQKKNSLILLEPKSETDVSFPNMNNINIAVIRSSEFWKGFLYGALIGGTAVALLLLVSGDDEGGFLAITAGHVVLFGVVIGGVIGGLIAVAN